MPEQPITSALVTPWVLRALWVALPFTAGPLFGDAMADASRPVQLTGTAGLWVAWAATLLALLVPLTATLTAVRIAVPGAVAAAAWAAVEAGTSGATVLALTTTVAAAVLALAPAIGAVFVNGSAYGNERRLPLRIPAPILLGPAPIGWAIVIATALALPILIAAKAWIPAIAIAVAGLPASYVAVRSLHALARRWLVFVPAGVVLHDLMAMADPVLIKRNGIARFGPALSDTDATDLSMKASGLALELRVREAVTLSLRPRPGAAPEETELSAVLVTPTRPGEALEEASRRRITVG